MGADEVKLPKGWVLDPLPKGDVPKKLHINPGNTQPLIQPEPGLESSFSLGKIPFLSTGQATALGLSALIPAAGALPAGAAGPVVDSLTMARPLAPSYASKALEIGGAMARRLGPPVLRGGKELLKLGAQAAGLGGVMELFRRRSEH